MATNLSNLPSSGALAVNEDQWLSFTAYQVLDPNLKEIRLLTVVGHNYAGILQCSIRHAMLSEKPKYHALSYYWGAPVPKKELLPIMVDQSLTYVKPTLSALLHNLYTHVGSLTIWLDFICIDQNNVKERNHQVSMMGEIFATAFGVYAWLGEADADTNYAFDALSGTTATDQIDHKLLSQYVEHILFRPYWTRTWVIQEFILAQTITLVCGTKTLPWVLFERYFNQPPHDEYAEYWRIYKRFKDGRAIYHNAEGIRWHDSLYELITIYGQSRCTDPRDKIYALLGLSSEKSIVPADYSISVTDLFYKVLSLHPPLTSNSICEHDVKNSHSACDPRETASRLQRAFKISDLDLTTGLKSKPEDRLYAWFSLKGYIKGNVPIRRDAASASRASISSPAAETIYKRRYEVQGIDGKYADPISTDQILHHGDHVYSAVHEVNTKSTSLIYRPSSDKVIDMLVMDNYNSSGSCNILEACSSGIRICSMSWQPRAQRSNLLLVHLSRQAHYVLWLQPKELGNEPVSARFNIETSGPKPECHCSAHESGGHPGGEEWEYGHPEKFLTCHTIIKPEKHLKPMRAMHYSRPW